MATWKTPAAPPVTDACLVMIRDFHNLLAASADKTLAPKVPEPQDASAS